MQRIKYKNFRIDKINTKEFKHIKLLFFWLIFGAVFWSMERIFPRNYHYVKCALDDAIPFCEYFVIPYYFWFIYLIGTMIYGFFYELEVFKNYMMFTIFTYTITLVIYALFPTAQALRPSTFPRTNVCTSIVKFLYKFDTNTNVCPSIHVLGSMAVYFAARKSSIFGGFGWRICFLITTLIISISTIFLKQHSLIDIIVALLVCAVCYPLVYGKKTTKKEKQYV